MKRSSHKVLSLVNVLLFSLTANGFSQIGTMVPDPHDAAGPPFEVAVVRPAQSDHTHGFGLGVTASGRFTASAVSLMFLIRQAYWNEQGKSAVVFDRSAPRWTESDEFDIRAKVDDAYLRGWDTLTDAERLNAIRPMIRELLADRFHLKVQVEMRPTPVYALVQARGGARLQAVAPPAPPVSDPNTAISKWMQENPGKVAPGFISCDADKCIANTVKISDVIGQIAVSSGADRTVVDETGLTGYYSFTFPISHDADGSEMQILERELGIRFEPRSRLIKTYVIQSAEKPSLDGSP